ncbi:hypothetical protein BP6252_11846 [Coleophoma cylindrospora]|uniref:Xylanolytic transcriptional activator regulatory domain-containing protein n=1 Tax=Coleophoma cylindrospora TaxID=1849047 RepID=A0A3D8QKP9_9HELO|nr:hypothetical protein BP6252_11846 [Coleophoma cylindrospora]
MNGSYTNDPVSQSPGFSMDSIDLGPPIATLRSLGALSKESAPPSDSHLNGLHNRASLNNNSRSMSYDPISRGILSSRDAQKAINIFFDHCHPHAPLLSEKLRQSCLDWRASSPTLFLAICSVGARFWGNDISRLDSNQGLHPRFFDLTALLDTAVSRLLLQPTPLDVTLDSIRVLLLYAQWMPCSHEDENRDSLRAPNAHPRYKSRYNDISAWAVLGLAVRYAVILGLDRAAIAPFQGSDEPISEEDMSRLRVWHNLVTCDCNLMLASGLPASLDPAPAASVARVFGTHSNAQQPADLRVTALVELVVIAHRATRSSSDFSGRHLDTFSLRKANTELDEWERSWVVRLRHTESQHNQLPFTSVRWYRLAFNSASLGPILSSLNRSEPQPLQISLLQSLETSLTAASQMLLSLSSHGAKYVWQLESQDTSSFPEGRFSVDAAALKRLKYAVDSTWISHTFAVTFLVLCYVRGTIDDNLRICGLSAPTSSQTCTAPVPPQSTSIITRLVRLALEIFDGVCQSPAFHPARDFQAIVHNASLLILSPENTESHNQHEIDNSAMQSLLDLIDDSGLEWPGNLLDTGTDFTTGWGVDGMLGV